MERKTQVAIAVWSVVVMWLLFYMFASIHSHGRHTVATEAELWQNDEVDAVLEGLADRGRPWLWILFPSGIGLGNRMQAIWAAYVLAHTQNWHPVVVWRDESADFDFDDLFSPLVEVHTEESIITTDLIHWLDNGVHHDISAEFAAFAGCSETHLLPDNIYTFAVRSSQEYTFLLHGNPAYFDVVDPLLRPAFKQNFWRRVFNPHPEVYRQTEYHPVGLQVRRHDTTYVVPSAVHPGNTTLLHGYMTEESEDVLIGCADLLRRRHSLDVNDRIYIATDRWDDVKSKFEENNSVDVVNRHVNLMWHSVGLMQARAALEDIYALADSASLALTPGSTFGAAAHALADPTTPVYTVYKGHCVSKLMSADAHCAGVSRSLCPAFVLRPEWHMLCPDNVRDAACTEYFSN